MERLERRQLLASDFVGVVSPDGQWQIDLDRDGEHEVSRKFGLRGDHFVSGNWEGSGDQFAVARPNGDGFFHWYLNSDSEGTPIHEIDFLFGLDSDIPVAGDWNGDGRDNVGVVRRNTSGGLTWYKDLVRDPSPQKSQTFGLPGDIPVVGDWNNDGISNVGVVRPIDSGHLKWFFDTTGDEWPEMKRRFGLPGDVPIVGDWNGDGRTNIGVARPVSTPSGEFWQWHLSTATDMNSQDIFADVPVFVFGDANHAPVVGNWQFSQLALSTRSLDFGQTQSGVPVTRSVDVSNSGSAPLTLTPNNVPSGFTIQTDFGNTLAPGRSGNLSVRMDSDSVGAKGGPLTFATNVGDQPHVTIDLTGRVVQVPELPRGEVRAGRISRPGEAVRYHFNAEARERFELQVATATPHELEIEVIRPDGGRIGGVRHVPVGDWTDSARHKFTIPQFHHGEFVVEVRSRDGQSVGDFWIGLESISTPSPNASTLALGQPVSGRLRAPIQVDQYKIEAQEGDRWEIEIRSDALVDAKVRKPGGASKNTGSPQNGISGTRRFQFSVLPNEGGTYLLSIRSHDNFAEANYTVTLRDARRREKDQRSAEDPQADSSDTAPDTDSGDQGTNAESAGVPNTTNPPTKVFLTENQVVENTNTSSGSLRVGSLRTDLTVADETETFLYELDSSNQGNDNPLFEVVDDELFVKQGTEIDFETRSEYVARIRVTTGSGETLVNELTVSVVDMLEIAAVIVNNGEAQRSRVETVRVEFDGEAIAPADAFEVRKLGDGGGTVDFAVTTTVVAGRTVADLQFSGGFAEFGSLVDGNYTLTVDGTKVQRPSGELLDANRDGAEGGDFVFGNEATDNFFRLFGDADGDGDVDITDLNDFFIPAFGTLAGESGYRPDLDADGDGDIDITDLNDYFIPNFGAVRPELVIETDDFGVIWTEGAEDGATHVIDRTDEKNSLIQSVYASEGENAFHLAHPLAASSWFEIDRTLAVKEDTRLFFSSRLSWATSTQVARVQLSTDGGQTWPFAVYSQSLENWEGERGFVPRQVDLSDFAGQYVRIRFFYEYVGGSRFAQVSPGIGWMVDDIRVASRYETAAYSIGDPTDSEQWMLELANRGRADAVEEANRLAAETGGGENDPIVGQYAAAIENGEFERHAQPLTFNAILLEAARLHSQDMLDNGFQGHDSSADPPEPFSPGFNPTQRSESLGYRGGVGENAFAYSNSAPHAHSAFSRSGGHRRNLHNGDFNQVGFAALPGTNGNIGPLVVTQKFGNAASPFITGVVYEDLDGNAFYTPGEGRGGVRIEVDGAIFHAVSTGSGGYAVPVPGNGEYRVTFSGPGIESWSTQVTVDTETSVKVDYVIP